MNLSTRKKKKSKTFISRRFDTKYLGEEPSLEIWDGEENYGDISNWYNYFYKTAEMWEWVEPWIKTLEIFNKNELEVISNLGPVRKISLIARQASKGAGITEECQDYVIRTLIEKIENYSEMKSASLSIKKQKPVFDKIKDQANDIISLLDDVIDLGDVKFNIFEEFQKNHLKIQHVTIIKKYYQPILDDVDNKKYYTNLSKEYKTKLIAILKQIIACCDKIENKNKLEQKVRKASKKIKIPSKEKMLKFVKYQKFDKDLNIASISLEKIIGADVVWFFNTKYKTLSLLQSNDIKGLQVHRTSITGFEEKGSFSQSLRKPQEILPVIIKTTKQKTTAGKIKEINNLTTKKYPVKTFRLNENILILKAF